MKKGVAALLFAVAMTTLPSVAAEDKIADVTDMQSLREAVKADKKAYVASMLALTSAEAKKFWPAYDAYQRSIDVTNRERNVTIVDVVGQDKPVSDQYAGQIAREIMLADEAEMKARRTLYNRVMKALPAKKAARYLQLEAKIRTVQAYDIARTIPLIK